MIDPAFFEYLYYAATMQRWNDHLRPHKGFTELDKQSHKMVYAFILAHIEESENKNPIDWQKLIEGGLFELLQRITLTDIKPPIFHQLMSKKGNELNEWFINKLECTGFFKITGDFREKIRSYFFDPAYCPNEKRILSASHYLATNWEFAIVYRFSSGSFGLEDTKANIASELEEHLDLDSVKKLQNNKKLSGFLDLIGQLRFQQRWAQSPRIPETSVLGHMLIVAIMAYVISLRLGACNKRLYNNYFTGLFHDLPEVLTRDIISPVKRSVGELDEIIKEIEKMQVSEKILPLLPVYLCDEIKYYTQDEFSSKVRIDGKITPVSDDEINTKYNSCDFDPLDGHLLRGCDKLAAFLEAYLSIKSGIDTSFLREGCESIYSEYKDKIISGFDFGNLFRSFKPEEIL
ncbi:MAG: HD domain-containing protein [Eubacteriales bacterium]|nr:HD domain-containing protein [Eubacteriales bacterium]